MKRALTSIDRFGVSPSFRVAKSDSSKSVCGGILTIMILGYLLASIWIASAPMVFREKPTVVVAETASGVDEVIPLSKNGFNAAITMSNIYSQEQVPIEGVYEIYPYLLKVPQTLPNGTQIPAEEIDLPLKQCDQDDFAEDVETIYGYCVDTSEIEVDVKRFEDTLFIFYLEPCINSTENGNYCRPQEEINYIFATSYIYIFTQQGTIDPDDFENPIKYYRSVEALRAPGNQVKEVRFFLTRIEFHSDQKWFGESDDLTITSQVQSKLMDTYTPEEGFSEKYMEVIFNVQPIKKVYHRSYKKLEDVLGEVTGLVLTILNIGVFLIMPYLQEKYYEQFIKEAYSVKNNDGLTPLRRKMIIQKIQNLEPKLKDSKFLKNQEEREHFQVVENDAQNNEDYIDKNKSHEVTLDFDGGWSKQEDSTSHRVPDFSVKQSIWKRKVKSSAQKDSYDSAIRLHEKGVVSDGEEEKSTYLNDTKKFEFLSNKSNQSPALKGKSCQQQNDSAIQLKPSIQSQEESKPIARNKNKVQDSNGYDTAQLQQTASPYPQKMEYGLLDWVTSRVSKKAQNQFKKFEAAKTQIENNLDVCVVFKKLRELDLLKHLLLSNEQVLVLESLVKKSIDDSSWTVNWDEIKEWKIEDYLERVEAQNEEIGVDQIDRKLIEFSRIVYEQEQ